MPKLKPGTIIPTDEEDRIITRQAIEDDTLLDDDQLERMRPVNEFSALKTLKKRGRPRQAITKQSTTLRLDAEVVEFFKSQGRGWQTRMNAVLLEHVRQQRSS